MSDTRLRFGKYKGTRLVDVPEDYLLYIIENSKKTIKEYTNELERRKQIEEADMSISQRIIQAGFRHLAKDCHPDHGGDPDKFRELQSAKTLLLETVKQLED